MLRVRNLRAGYGSLDVIKGVSFHVAAGEIVALIGANGAGKTSLLRALVGLLPPAGGRVWIGHRDTTALPPWQAISTGTVLIPEGRQLFADMSVMDNLILGGFHNPDRDLQIAEMLERFPRLRERSRQLAGTLSGGEQQMLALARGLVSRPSLLLLDEPSLGLAPLIVQEVFETIRGLKDLGVTVLMVEQNAIGALRIADRGYVLETGEITLEGDSADLLANPEVKRAYLGKGYREVWE
ncbi:MAG: ABC transporter ATP-binding protein [Lentisphaerae bacterium]|nr:ABC transporter ATP-binding protein [Lentisphaerota bacterium]